MGTPPNQQTPKKNESMNTDIRSKSPTNQLQDAAGEVGRRAADAARDVTNAASDTYQSLSSKVGEGVERTKEYAQHAVDATKDAAHRATDTAKDIYHSASAKAEDMLVSSKEYVHQNPFPVALGTLIAGLALGYMIGLAQREQPTLRQRLFS
jgi:ElaB/YqjD/DUF883 family membrane-anchored ribosome-binding protein